MIYVDDISSGENDDDVNDECEQCGRSCWSEQRR